MRARLHRCALIGNQNVLFSKKPLANLLRGTNKPENCPSRDLEPSLTSPLFSEGSRRPAKTCWKRNRLTVSPLLFSDGELLRGASREREREETHSEMATAWSGWRVWLSLLVLTWAAALRASPLSPATAGDKTSANGAKNDHTLPLLQLRSATHTAGDSETGPKITTSKHPDTKQTEIGRTYASTIAAVTNGDSPKLEPNVSAPQHCTDDFQCYSQNSNFSIPPSLVYCKNRTCVCNNCFVLINNTCAQKKCHHFNNASGKCVDERKSQKILLILSVFLSSTGSANLYIGQKVLG